jgi:prophage maintenance system killer protein
MFDFNKLSKKYSTEAPFNKAVNLFRQLIEKYGFMPSELREAAFLAQYMYEMNHLELQIRSDEEWEAFYKLKAKIQSTIVADYPELLRALDEVKVREGSEQ